MDLARLRKKAKASETGGKSVKKEAPPSSRKADSDFATAAKIEEPTLYSPAPAVDPLDALFSSPAEAGFANEEIYLQALRQQKSEATGNVRQLLAFSLGDEQYALDIACIREIIKPREVTDIPRVPSFILGIISLRGIIIPVFDLKQRLRLGITELSPSCRVVVCQHEERIVGLLVDSISQVVRLPSEKVEPPPAVLLGLGREMVEGVGRLNGQMMILLHLPCVVNAELV